MPRWLSGPINIFAPLTNLGVIIIDEEHEATYKQDSNPRYHARDVAKLRADYNRATLVLFCYAVS